MCTRDTEQVAAFTIIVLLNLIEVEVVKMRQLRRRAQYQSTLAYSKIREYGYMYTYIYILTNTIVFFLIIFMISARLLAVN